MVIFVSLQSCLCVLANKILLKTSGGSRSSYVTFFLPTIITPLFLGRTCGALSTSVICTFILIFLYVLCGFFFFSDTSLFIKLSSAEGMCNSETGCKGKSTMFQQADLRMMALMFVVCVYLQMLFMFIGKGDNKKLVIGISSGFLFFSAAVYRLEAIILR